MAMPFFALPVGFKFHPSDQDLVKFYLRPKATGQPLPFPDVISDLDLYGDKDPSEIWEMFRGKTKAPTPPESEEDLFFFTKLKWLSRSRVNRSVASGGTWSNESSKTIYARGTKIPIAKKRNFRYENPGSPQDGAWLMREYSLPMTKTKPDAGSSSLASYVVCRLRRNNRPDSDSSEPESLPQISLGQVRREPVAMNLLTNLVKRKRGGEEEDRDVSGPVE